MQRIRRTCLAAVVGVLCTASVSAYAAPSGATALDRFLDGLSTLRAEFSQRVVDARGREVQNVTGVLVVQRPGRFRWEVRPEGATVPGGQLLVADGRNLWFFDRDLEQVTVKPASSALTATPAMLLSGGADVRAAFRIESSGSSDGLEWVKVVPIKADADFREARFGFAGNDLRRMELNDKLGQKASLVFDRTQRNGKIDPSEVAFTPPAGADVIGTPAP